MSSSSCDALREQQAKFSAPMPWIGLYVVVASLVCTLAAAADVLHGFCSRKFWFPCKYFTLNAASLTVMAIAMKLPVDLTTDMSGDADQFTKLGSVGFMCTMLANFMPSLGTMDNNELLLNIIALGILVVTMAVNVYIQMRTGVVDLFFQFLAYLFVSMMLFLLIISISLALKVPVSKNILEWKYTKMHKRASNDEETEKMGKSTVDKLTDNVRKYWIMAETGDPQFVTASSPSCSASGAVSLIVAFSLLSNTILIFSDGTYHDHNSDYKWSVLPILVMQTIGVGVVSIAPIFRWFAALNFKLSIKWSKNHIMVFQIEKYWTKLLVDWKESRITSHIGGRKCKKVVHNVKNLILNFCIGFQIVIVMACKIIRLIPICFVIVFVYCSYCFRLSKRKCMREPSTSYNSKGSESKHGTKSDLSHYVLQLQDEVELAKRTLRNISHSMNHLIQKAEKQQPNNLINLLKKSTGFAGVAEFDNDQVLPLHSEEAPNCWSLPVVTLTSIAIALPKLKNDRVDLLLRSVSEGLFFINIVEENLCAKGDLPKIRKATNHLWSRVELDDKWLDNNLQKMSQKGKTSKEILQWLGDEAKNTVTGINNSVNRGPDEEFFHKFIAANSMYRISQTIMLNEQGQNDKTGEKLFERLEVMIADILGACLTNLPRVIIMKCFTEAIEKREQSVRTATRLLGRSKEILKILQELELPNLDPNKMAYVDEWRASLKCQNPLDSASSSGSETTITINCS